jgi:Ca-activated chloride channel homolog
VSFLWPQMLLALALVPIGVLAARTIDRRRRARASSFTRPAAGHGSSDRRRRLRFGERVVGVLFVSATALVVLALARPVAAIPIPRSEGTLILTFDVSGSMSADDVGATRLDAAKAAARALVAERPDGVVIGVVAFSDGGMSVQTPTADEAIVGDAIDRLAPAFGTSLGEGILVSLDTIAQVERGTPAVYYSDREPEATPAPPPQVPGSHSTAAIVLFTDGENTVPPDPATTAHVAADRGIRVHTVGVGSPTGTILDIDGFSVHTQVDTAMLRYMANVTAGTSLLVEAVASSPPDGATTAAMTAAIDADPIYASLAVRPTVDPEPIELTSVVAGLGALLLVAATMLSLSISGRAP